jgi:hypothetical protein
MSADAVFCCDYCSKVFEPRDPDYWECVNCGLAFCKNCWLKLPDLTLGTGCCSSKCFFESIRKSKNPYL